MNKNSKAEPKTVLVEAANGMLVEVPEDKLESWQKAQQEIREGRYKVDEQLKDKILSMIKGSQK